MQKYKKFFIKAFILTFICVAPIVIFNYTIDPYGIFRKNFENQHIEPNQQFIKMKYILKNPNKYDSFLFGSSRVGNIDTQKIKGEKFYNMTYSQGVPGEFARNIKTMVRNGVKIKTLMVGIDDFSYKFDPNDRYKELIRYPYTDDLQGRAYFYFTYLFKIHDIDILKPYFVNTPQRFPTHYDIWNSGRPLHPEIDEYIDNNKEKHLNDPRFNKPPVHKKNRVNATISEINEIIQVAKENNIKSIVFINPVYKTTYLANFPDQFSEFKRKLAEITPFYDFSGINSVTTNKLNYYEYSHYRVFIGDLIIARIFNYSETKVPTDFGVYVSKENIDMHLDYLRKQYKK
ncbi:MAG: hypothetical protein N3B21_17135 [Clostridia bacterium]|nr:hypothetical protein [Clostridia bacterium]